MGVWTGPGQAAIGMNASDVTVIIPAYNEAEAIGSVVEGLLSRSADIEVIVVDDASTDETPSLAKRAGARVFSHERTRGYGSSLRTGIRAAARPYVLSCDGDGQHSPEDVFALIAGIGSADMAVGVRGRDSHSAVSRRPGKFFLNRFADFLAGQHIPDLTSGLRVIRRDVILKYLHLMPKGFSFSATSTFALMKSDHAIKWLPITVVKRRGKSTVRQWKHGPQALLLILRLTILFEPLKVFLTIDGLLLFLTFVSFALDLTAGEGFGVGEVTVALSIATLMVFLFGLVCDQVSALRREIHD